MKLPILIIIALIAFLLAGCSLEKYEIAPSVDSSYSAHEEVQEELTGNIGKNLVLLMLIHPAHHSIMYQKVTEPNYTLPYLVSLEQDIANAMDTEYYKKYLRDKLLLKLPIREIIRYFISPSNPGDDDNG